MGIKDKNENEMLKKRNEGMKKKKIKQRKEVFKKEDKIKETQNDGNRLEKMEDIANQIK